MIPAYNKRTNLSPDFVGIRGMLDKLNTTVNYLEKSLEKNDFEKARNPDFIIWCCPSDIQNRFGEKYLVYDEIWELMREARDMYYSAVRLLLLSYGFDVETRCFKYTTFPIHRFDVITSDYMYRLYRFSNYIGMREVILCFICGFIDCGYIFIYNKTDYTNYWLKERPYSQLDVSTMGQSIIYRVNRDEKVLFQGDSYTYDILKSADRIKIFINDDDEKVDLRQDRYGRLWYHVYFAYGYDDRVEENFELVESPEIANENFDNGKYGPHYYAGNPYFHATENFDLILHEDIESIPEYKTLEQELLKVKQLNNLVPVIIGNEDYPTDSDYRLLK